MAPECEVEKMALVEAQATLKKALVKREKTSREPEAEASFPTASVSTSLPNRSRPPL